MKKLVLMFLLLGLARLVAVTPVPYLEVVSFTSKIYGTGSSTMTVYGEGVAGASGTVTITDSVSSSTHESDLTSALLRPGKACQVNFAGSGPGTYELSFTAPTGYSLYIDGRPSDLIVKGSLSGSYSHDYTIELRPVGSGESAAWGSFTGIALGKSISWEAGLGGLRNGGSAGRIMFKELDLSGNNAVRDRLYYTAPINYLQITVVKDGSSNQRLRQVAVPSGFVDLVDITNGYEMRFYTPAQGTWSSTLYTFTGSPWKTIAVTSTAAQQLQVVETEGSTVNTSELTETGQVATGVATGGTISTSGGGAYTIHSFTSSGSFVLNATTTVDYLVVGGGGGGGSHNNGGGGGGGSVQYLTSQSLSAGTYAATIGAGGAADANGSNSTFNSTTGYGGGHGGSASAGSAPTTGGSGGGGNTNGIPAGAGSCSNVYTGGGGDNGGSAWQGGGGGGAGGATQNPAQGGGTYTGGNGLANSITGSSTYYAGGGGGGSSGGTAMAGGSGGGGAGGYSASTSGMAGTANTGGGGSATTAGGSAGAGGSGVVIIRYAGGQAGNFERLLKEKSGGSTWQRTTKQVSNVPTSGERDVILSIYTGNSTSSGDLVARTKHHFVNKAWGEELETVTADPDASSPSERTTTYDYYATAPTSGSAANRGSYRRVKSVTEPTGNWVAYEYYDDYDKRGQLYRDYRPFKGSPSTVNLGGTSGRLAQYNYTYDWTGRYRALYTREEKIDGYTSGLLTRNQNYDSSTSNPRERYQQLDSSATSQYVTSAVEYYRADADSNYVGLPVISQKPSGQWDVAFYIAGFYDASTHGFSVNGNGTEWREWHFHGTGTTADGGESTTSYGGYSFDAICLIPNKSTLDLVVRSGFGAVLRSETLVYTGSGAFSSMTAEDFEYDAQCRLIRREAVNGAKTTWTYANGRLTSTVGVDGTETQFTYDNLGRVATSVKKGVSSSGSYAAQGDITTTNTYNVANQVTQQVVSDGSLSLTSTSDYDKAGRLTQTVAPGSYTTGYGYASGGKVVTVTLPGGATKVSETWLDGQLKSVTSTNSGVVAEYHEYTVSSSTGAVTHRVRAGADTTGVPYVETTADWLGRPVSEVRPAWSGTATRSWTYNSNGLLSKLTQPSLADTLYVYDTMGVLRREGLDIGGTSGTLDESSSDRITDHIWTYFSSGGYWWQRQTTKVFATASNATSTEIAKVEKQVGLPSNRLGYTKGYDVFGNVTISYTDVDRINKLVTTTTDVPDSTTDAITITRNGLTVSSRSTANLTTTFGFDGLGRPTTAVDPRNSNTTTTAYVSGTSQIYTVTDATTVTQATYTYDASGRVSSVKDALNKYSYTTYTNRGEVYRQWGDTTIPVEYDYDSWGHQVTMKTYRGGTGWTGSTWPGSPGTADTTTWAYQAASGLLESKTDATSKAIAYTYTTAGQIYTREWARILTGSTHVTTTYGYSSTTGELTSVDYNDSTTDLAYTYNRLGKIATVTDATGSRTLNYALGGTLEQESEDLPSYFGTRRVTYGYATSGVIGRPNALKLGTSGSPTADQSITYGYDTYGRFNSLAGGGTTLAYSYTTGSNLLAGIADSTSGWAQTRTYLSNRDLLDVIETKVSTTSEAKFDYAHDNLGRRTSVANTGELYNRYGTQGLEVAWGYDDRSQLTSEVTSLGGGATFTGRNNAYAYDTMGNRASSAGTTHNGNSADYTTNSLNQYTQRTVPGYFDVAGSAGSGTTVTVNGSSTGVIRHGEYFFKAHALTNTSSPVFSSLTISDGTTPFNLPAFLALTPEPFTYDDDGNLTRDGRWVYQYDAENRLVTMFTRGAPDDDPLFSVTANSNVWGSGLARQKLQFTYDYLGRRVGKVVSDWDTTTTPSTPFWSPFSNLHFVYDGWNIMAKLNAASSNALVASYYWGLDWSGTMQGAGGVGGLAIAVEGGNTYLPAYDGNGNVHGMIKASDGSLAAAYEYDAFGQTLRESGPYAADNPFRFATKFADMETGLVQYNTRYYSPSLGRFINRDTISEQGGLNLYAYCGNNGVNRWDHLGMAKQKQSESSGVQDGRNDGSSGSGGKSSPPGIIDGFLQGIRILPKAPLTPQQSLNDSLRELDDALGAQFGMSGGDFRRMGGIATPTPSSLVQKAADVLDQAVYDLKVAAFEEFVDAVQNIDQKVADYGIAGAVLREVPVLNVGADIVDFYNGETTSGRIYSPLEWGLKGVSVTGTAAMAYGTISMSLTSVAAESRMTTVIGSMDDVARFKGQPGYNVLERPAGMSDAAFGRYNAEWMNTSLRRGDTIMAVTDPAAHRTMLEGIRPGWSGKSNYLQIELPMLEHFGATVPKQVSVPPVVPFYFTR